MTRASAAGIQVRTLKLIDQENPVPREQQARVSELRSDCDPEFRPLADDARRRVALLSMGIDDDPPVKEPAPAVHYRSPVTPKS
jgi:hypothetical protein